MGEIADAMINGEMCEWCGEWLGGDAGFPRLCAGCQNTPEGKERIRQEKPDKLKKGHKKRRRKKR